jgi:hypothetical protein
MMPVDEMIGRESAGRRKHAGEVAVHGIVVVAVLVIAAEARSDVRWQVSKKHNVVMLPSTKRIEWIVGQEQEVI